MDEHDIASELSNLRREVLEMRNLIIKTDNLLKTFHLELKEVGRKQAEAERQHRIGHVGGYVAIAVVALGAALLYGSAAASGARAEAKARLEQARQIQTEAQTALASARERTTAQEQVSSEAMTIWQLITSPDSAKQDEGLVKAAKLDMTKLPPFTRAAIEQAATSARRTRAEEAMAAAMSERRPTDPKQAVVALEQFLAIAKSMPSTWHRAEQLQASYQLGALYNQLAEHEKAIPHLRRYVAEGSTVSTKAYAYLLLGDSLQATQHNAEAEQAFRAGLKLGPTGVTAGLLRRRLGEDPAT